MRRRWGRGSGGRAGGRVGAQRVLQDADEELDEEGGGEGCNTRARYCALLVEGCVFDGLGVQR